MTPSRPYSLSPPPLKRRRVSPPPAPRSPSTSTPHPPDSHGHGSTQSSLSPCPVGTLRVFTWNINGIDPFLPTRARDQRSITTFFSSTDASSSSSHLRTTSNDTKKRKPSLRRCLRRWGWPHVVCLQEVKIARSDHKTQDAVLRAANHVHPPDVNSSNEISDDESDSCSSEELDKKEAVEKKDGPEYDVHFSLPRDKHNARGPHGNGKVYGVCTLVRRDLLRVVNPRSAVPQQQGQGQDQDGVPTTEIDWDLEGRVLLTLIPHPPSAPAPPTPTPTLKGLALFNIYAINGTTNPHRDSSTGTIIGDRHAQKRRFHTHLASAVRAYQTQGYQVVVAGDLNIARAGIDSYPALRLGGEHVENRADFEEKFMRGGLGMVDSFRHVHGLERKYTYRPPGRPWGAGMDRVDLILCSSDMVGEDVEMKRWKLMGANILDTEEERGPSDHVPLFVDVAFGEAGSRGAAD